MKGELTIKMKIYTSDSFNGLKETLENALNILREIGQAEIVKSNLSIEENVINNEIKGL